MTCIERKIRLNGEVDSYRCDLLALEPDHGVLKYVVSERRTVASATLLPGTVTFALYWPERNYNLYYWALPEDPPTAADGCAEPAEGSEGRPSVGEGRPPTAKGDLASALRPIGYYINIVDSVSLTPACFTYRDLVLDLFIAPGGEPVVLDEEELPLDIEPALHAFIEAIKRQLLRDHRRILQEADRLLAPHLCAA